jgi:hypothetical protein
MNDIDKYHNQQEIQSSTSSESLQYNGQGLTNEDKMEILRSGVDLTNKFIDTYAEIKRVEAKARMVNDWSKTEITKTVAKFKASQEFLYLAFGERNQALFKHYDLLDKAVASDDKELILAALQGISNIVTESPLKDFEHFSKLFDDTSQPLVDF